MKWIPKKIKEYIMGVPAQGIPAGTPCSTHTVVTDEKPSMYQWGINIRQQLMEMSKRSNYE